MPTTGAFAPGEQGGDGRHRVRQLAVLGPDGAVADRDRAADDGVDPEDLERDADTDDVDDRVERADLVELDVAGVDAVDLAFDLGEGPVDRERPIAGAFGKVGRADQLEHVAGPTVSDVRVVGAEHGRRRVVVIVHGDVRPRRADTAPLHALERERVPVDTEPGESVGDRVHVGTGIDERRQQHVAGHARAAVEPHRASAHRRSTRATAHAAPKPLSMPTTVTPLAHEASIASNAVTPSRAAP